MSVRSVATSVSPTSASSIFSSQSYSTESTMVTPTEGLVSQQILSIPSSSTIVDMATLTSLNMHSCNGTNLVCRNVQSLPSQESSFPVYPEPCISKLTTSKMTKFNENSANNQENFKSSSLANSLYSIPNSNCKYDNCNQNTPASSSQNCATEFNALDAQEKADKNENYSVMKITLPKSYLQLSCSVSDSRVCCKHELECLNAFNSSTRMQRIADPLGDNLANHSSIIFENEQNLSSLKPLPKLPSVKEDQNDNTLIFHYHKENEKEVHFCETSHRGCLSCDHNNLFMLNGVSKAHYLEGKFNCASLNQNSSSAVDRRRNHLNESSERGSKPPWCLTSYSGLPSPISSVPFKQTKKSCNGYIYSGANVLSIPCHLVDKHLNFFKSALVMSPQNGITSNGVCEFLSPKALLNSDLASSNLEVNTFSGSCLSYGMKKRWIEEQLVLVLAEVPAFSHHSISLDLSKIIPQLSFENAGLERKAVFMRKSFGLSSNNSIKNGILSYIKVVPAKNHFNSTGESSISSCIPCDQVFVKIIPAANIIINLNSSSSIKVLPLYGVESGEDDSLSGFMPCAIVSSERHDTNGKISMPSHGNQKSLYVGLLVPSTKLLHSLNISICQKDSLSIRLGSSRPNQQYSTHTSVDLQLNGNNVEFIPIIPLGVYSQSESSDPDIKFLASVAENSFRNVHNIEDIFLKRNDSREEVLDPDVTSQKQLRSADVLSTKSPACDPEAQLGLSKEDMLEQYCFTNPVPPESTFERNKCSSLKSKVFLECLAERPGNVCKDSVNILHAIAMLHEDELIRGNEGKCQSPHKEKRIADLHFQRDLVHEKNGLTSLLDEVLSKKPSCNSAHVNEVFNLTTKHLPHPSHVVQPLSEGNALQQECELIADSKICPDKVRVMEKGIDSLCDQKSTFSAVKVNNVQPQLQNNLISMSYSDPQKDHVGFGTPGSNCYSVKRKTPIKRSEGYFKPFRISKTNRSKPVVDLKKGKEFPVEEKSVKMREELNSKLCSAMKSAASTWKHNPYGSNCLDTIKNIIVSSAHFNSTQNPIKDHSKEGEESNRGTVNKMKCKPDRSTSVSPKLSQYGDFSSRGRGRQPSNFKSPDKRFSRNFFLSPTSSTKRSKLAIIIFCLAVTSLLISLHALSTDSSLYIKPTFFLVQEDDTSASSFSSESSYIKKSSLHQSENGEANGPIYHSILVKEEIGVVKEEKGADGSITYIKSRKDTLNWTRSGMDESMEIKSKNGILSEVGLKSSGFKMTVGRTEKESKQLFGVSKNILNNSNGKSDFGLKPSMSKAAYNFLNNANFTSSKSNGTSALHEKTEYISNSPTLNENLVEHSGVSGGYDTQHLKSVTESVKSSSHAASPGGGGNSVSNEDGAQLTLGTKDDKILGLSSTENLTKLPSNDEGGSGNHNDFDLNIAFIEKNELNAAYGIDSGTTGAEGNFEEDYLGEEDMTQMATSGNRVKFPKATRRLPQALIIGVRKGGTRALLEMLHLHPLVQKAAGEAHFFDRDENYAKGLQWYRRRMPPSLKGQITVEKSPSYFVTPEVPERVRAMNASIRLLLIVREPVTRAISDFAQLRSHSLAAKANTTIRTKLEGVDEDYGKKVTRPLSSFESLAILPDGRVDMSWRPISVSLYHRHISAWLEAFPRDQILIVDGDQLASNPAPVLASVEKFLKLRPALTPTHFYFNATKGFYCLRSLPPGQPVDGMAMMPSSLSHSSSLPEGKCLRESKGRRHPHVDPSVVHKLRRFFAEHNRRFYEMVGEDFGWPEE
ncbi:uncharacterized protein [Hetaerina americana]|uniref:uncharacterized protein n=1 Tax=Hetaerina americana TaxID=62018 RepID=UPI003A7F49BE